MFWFIFFAIDENMSWLRDLFSKIGIFRPTSLFHFQYPGCVQKFVTTTFSLTQSQTASVKLGTRETIRFILPKFLS